MIQVKTIDGVLLRDMFVSGAALLEKKRERVDALNVFPVPDGDTGTNMSLTMNSAVKEINQKEYLYAGECAAAMAKGALRGARGNSGVITSQLFRGFAKALDRVERITPLQFAAALQKGVDTAYKAVMKPKEGTILTVARVIAEEAMKQVKVSPDDYDALFNTVLTSGDAILQKTQTMLPALTQAGVVDAGGKGLLYIYRGFVSAFRGEEVPEESLSSGETAESNAQEDSLADADRHPYQVSFEIHNLFPEVVSEDIDSCRRRLNRIGDHVSVSGDLTSVKVNACTAEPDKALEFGLSLGELSEISIQNRLILKRKQEAEKVFVSKLEPSQKYGVVAVSLGSGFDRLFTELGANYIVSGGQTMNPSIDDLANAIDKTDAKTVFVLPNNGNVILAAQQARALCEGVQVAVIPTKNTAMGVAALIAFNPEADFDTNWAEMEAASERVHTGMVTYAVRSTEIGEMHIEQGDIIGLSDGSITRVGSDIYEIAKQLAQDIVTDDDTSLTVYYGADTPKTEAEKLGKELEELCSGCEISVQEGGQPLYYYLIAAE